MILTPAVRATVVCVAALTVSSIVLAIGATARQASSSQALISGPSEWVPLSYTVKVTYNGVEELAYTMHQSSNGSTRKDEADGHIEIKNLGTGRFYRFDHGVWYDHPVRRQGPGGKPFLKIARAAVADVPSDDPRLSTLAGAGISCSFVRMLAAQDRVTSILCPELNLLEVYNRRSDDKGISEFSVTSISLGEPQVSFLPPAGVNVTQRADATGAGFASRTPTGYVLRKGELVKEQR